MNNEFQFGNFPNYYGYRHDGTLAEHQYCPLGHDLCTLRHIPAFYQHLDPRLKHVAAIGIKNKRVLDIGCNAGNVSIQLARDMDAQFVLGVDVDSALISKAKRAVSTAYARASRFPGTSFVSSATSDAVYAIHGDTVTIGKSLLGAHERSRLLRYDCVSQEPTGEQGHIDAFHFPASMPQIYGWIPWASKPPAECASHFPHNVKFQVANVLEDVSSIPELNATYDVVLLLSITKWIHLHYGDGGIKFLFQKCFEWLASGGVLVVEPQPWHSYARQLEHEVQSAYTHQSLEVRPLPSETNGPSFWSILMEMGFAEGYVAYQPPEDAPGFRGRPIWCFRKP